MILEIMKEVDLGFLDSDQNREKDEVKREREGGAMT
jgi:hypothetical protein